MADAPKFPSDNTREEVAFKLFKEVAVAEGKELIDTLVGAKPDRKWILDTYAECLVTVYRPQQRLSSGTD